MTEISEAKTLTDQVAEFLKVMSVEEIRQIVSEIEAKLIQLESGSESQSA